MESTRPRRANAGLVMKQALTYLTSERRRVLGEGEHSTKVRKRVSKNPSARKNMQDGKRKAVMATAVSDRALLIISMINSVDLMRIQLRGLLDKELKKRAQRPAEMEGTSDE